MKANPRLTIKQIKGGAHLTYAVQVTVFVRAHNAAEAQGFVDTALQEWSKFIPAYRVDDVQDAADMHFTGGRFIPRPENIAE